MPLSRPCLLLPVVPLAAITGPAETPLFPVPPRAKFKIVLIIMNNYEA